ncbi:MAG: transcription-repair coupling factor, partial [Oligoflexales bacterium]|nr:transcription-repair coupling factor [Oligoflexales bacterium]
ISELANDHGATIIILAHNEESIERIETLLVNRHLSVNRRDSIFSDLILGRLKGGEIYVSKGYLSEAVWSEENLFLIIPEDILFGNKREVPIRSSSTRLKNYLKTFKDLRKGDLVVHVKHGVCRYQGITVLNYDGYVNDFIYLQFAGSDRLYLPTDSLNMLQRYNIGGNGNEEYPLDNLKGNGWIKRKERVKKAVDDIAAKLVEIQAKRAVVHRSSYSAQSDIYYQVESDFPFEETEDQLKVIDEVNFDLSKSIPMDRLVCGDVGFGKTEVAIRAATRVILDGYQVMVLTPTTVLCFQHYLTFSQRLRKYGINVSQINRFIKADELNNTKASFSQGKIDLIVGTHRLLSKDINPKKLGLIVIDEEQRFGVKHKELIKELSQGCDVLTLSATPIPRTLHMAMLGLRDISLISTPPNERLAIKTYISEFDDRLIKGAIEAELRRGGQVFFIHNTVEDIVRMCSYLKDLVPNSRVEVAHGQMQSSKLENVIIDFIQQKFPILLCTTIIESGIDMPNVNTLIVNNAERFGLSQLYQMRGRVGRSGRQSFAYFLTGKKTRISDDAKRRLEILVSHQELGAGFQIASYDLEMRGAGTLLGPEQSGHIADVGFEMYTELLDTAINEIRGRDRKVLSDIEIKIPVSAYIPKEYILSENQRLHYYKRLFSVNEEQEVGIIRDEVEDRFGKMPVPCVRIFKVASVKQLLRISNIASCVFIKNNCFEIKFYQLSESEIFILIELVSKNPECYKITPDYKLIVSLGEKKSADLSDQDFLLNKLSTLIEPLAFAFKEGKNYG